jgi:hypothetical protein
MCGMYQTIVFFSHVENMTDSLCSTVMFVLQTASNRLSGLEAPGQPTVDALSLPVHLHTAARAVQCEACWAVRRASAEETTVTIV